MENEDYLIDVFLNRYTPVISIEEADELLSSNELVQLFSTASKVDKDQLFELLKQRGFKLECIGKQFVWLLKEKQF